MSFHFTPHSHFKSLVLITHLDFAGHVDSNDKSEQTDGRAENLNDEDLDEKGGVSSIGQSCSRANDSNGDATEEIDEADGESSAKHNVTSHEVVAANAVALRHGLGGEGLQKSWQNNRCNQSVNGDSLTEDNRDEIFCFDSWRFDTSAHDRCAGSVDSQRSSDDWESHGEGNSETGPHIGTCLREEPTDGNSFTLSREDMVENPERRQGHERACEGVSQSVTHPGRIFFSTMYWRKNLLLHTLTEHTSHDQIIKRSPLVRRLEISAGSSNRAITVKIADLWVKINYFFKTINQYFYQSQKKAILSL